MTYNPSRRLFLGGSLAASAAGAAGIITPAGLASAKTMQAPGIMYGPTPGVAKLNANENPYGPSDLALKAIAEASKDGGAYYAYRAGMYLRDMLAESNGLKPENVSITAGSSLILAFAAFAATSKGKILGPDLFWVLLYSIYFLFPDYVVRPGMSFSMPKGPGKAILAFVIGGFSALLGIGGGTPTVITMVMCRRTIQQAVATAAGVGVLIGLPGAIGFLFMKNASPEAMPFGTVGYINLPALIAISVGSIMTAPIGASMAHSFSEKMLKRLFGVYLVIVSVAMFSKAL